MAQFILALDQGTTSSRAVLFDEHGCPQRSASRPLGARFPEEGWVEQDPHEIWHTQLAALEEVVRGVPPGRIAAIGITNQRETIVAWDRRSGAPLAPAIVWQCRRSNRICERLRGAGLQAEIAQRTGLVIDSYFSATKILWLLENMPDLKEQAARGSVVFGTVDSWLLYNLTAASGAPTIATEPSNACRTMLYNIRSGDWDGHLLRRLGIERRCLPELRPSAGVFGFTNIHNRAVPICGVLGDQQASLFGHGCVLPNQSKCTFGTGAFLLLGTGEAPVASSSGLLSSVGWNLDPGAAGCQARSTFVLEGSVFMAGALIQWLRDQLGLIPTAAASEQVAAQVADSGGVVIVPAFIGLGAPYWDEQARGAILGLTRGTSAAHLVRAALEAVAEQVADLVEAPEFAAVDSLRIDGGMSVNSLFCQMLADRTGLNVEAMESAELSALGAAQIALLGSGLASDVEAAAAKFAQGRAGRRRFVPRVTREERAEMRKRWKQAVAAVRTFKPSHAAR